MPGKFCVSLSYAKDNADKATVAFVIATAALASDKETMVFLSTEAVRLAQQGYADEIHEEGFARMALSCVTSPVRPGYDDGALRQ